MNNLAFFSPSQTAVIIAVAVVGVVLIVLNIVLAYIFNKRGERKLYDLLLQQQREFLMRQLEEMRAKGAELDNKPADIKPFFVPANAQQQPVEEAVEEPEEAEEEIILTDFSDDEDTVEEEEVIIDGKVVRYNRSFAARLIQSSDELKSRYSRLKNLMLSYDKVKSRISWKKESFRRGRVTLATLVIRGKTLCLCLATDAKRFAETKYKVVDLSERSPKNKQPCLYRITSDRRAKYAEELIDLVFGENGAVKGEFEYVDYTMPYEPTEQLIEEQLIKVINGSDNAVPAVEAQVTEEVIEEIAPAEEVAEEPEEVEEEIILTDFSDDEDTVEEEEVIIDGKVVRYNRSFAARLIQSSDELKARYSRLKNVMLSYDKVKSRRSWKKVSYRRGRVTLATLVIRGKTLCLCLATDAKRFAETKYKVVDLSERSPKNKQPCLYRITSDRRAKYAEELIDLVFGENGAVKGEFEYVDYTMPYETTEQLIEEQLIKVINGSTNTAPVVQEPVAQEQATEEVTEEIAVVEAPVEEVTEEQPEAPVEEVTEEQPEEPVEEVIEEQPEEPVEEVTEEQPEEPVEEVTEEQPEEPAEEDVLVERDFEILEEVDVTEAETFSDEQAKDLVELKVVRTKKKAGKKGIVNLDSLSKNFEEGAHITVETLKEKGLIAKDVKVLKVLAKGSINKPLIVEADDFSLVAVKMIVLTGGRVIKRTTDI